ncbi:hypothetical protein OIU34_23435 [Pararhizobium sp. BT-229]|uniref:hypothetical protein n=1 Tax=Pararhizobium sp. BT-229 TaxID=2986923 RepID=UPI0021F7ACE1|nr:hypothetical protein [Pararhizobium sp. BT-229]MCV9964850.1 hypothetical protein [Pararhizobium sp. BT-229]
MGYVADFVTGRSISEGEPAVGIVIVPRTGGWPDPIKAAAVDPVHAHDRFSPLSLPLDGFINDQGYFEPKGSQLALQLLLDTVGFDTWASYFEKAYAFGEENGGIKLDGERVIAGVAVMRPETYRSVISTGRRGQRTADSAIDAARILIDAQKRWNDDHDNSCFFVALMANPPRGGVWKTKDGAEIEIPHCSLGLADGYCWDLNAVSKEHIRQTYANAYRRSPEELAPLFGLFSDFQNLSRGLADLGKYFAPAGFMRHDNLNAVTSLQLDALEGAILNAAERRRTGVESREDRLVADMVGLQKKLSNLQRLVHAEIVKANQYLGADSEPEAERVPEAPKPRQF